MSSNEKVQKTIRIPKDQHDAVQEQADKEHRSFTKQMTFILQKWYEGNKGKNNSWMRCISIG